MKKVILKTNGAMGDTIWLTSLIKPLRKIGLEPIISTNPSLMTLFEGLEIETIDESRIDSSKDLIIDTSKYWLFNPESEIMPSEYSRNNSSELTHLSEWLSYALDTFYGLKIKSSKNNVKVILREDEIRKAKNKFEILFNDKPSVVLSLFSTTKNRNLPRKTIENILEGLKEFSIPIILPYAKLKDLKSFYLPDKTPIRETAAILYIADQIVGVDTGTTHLANAVLQGTEDYRIKGLNPSKEKVLWLLGGTHPEATIYEGNKFIYKSPKVCPLEKACGAVGYSSQRDAERQFKLDFYSAGKNDNSFCVFNDYPESETSKCMSEITADEIISTVYKNLKHSS